MAMAGRAAVFIDGGYLDKVLYHDFQNARILFDKLVVEMASPDEMMRAYYYHCLPYRGNPPTEEDNDSHQCTASLPNLDFCHDSKSVWVVWSCGAMTAMGILF